MSIQNAANMRVYFSKVILTNSVQHITRLQVHLEVQYLLHVKNIYVFIPSRFIPAHPHLKVISSGLLQLPVEPWRAVEGAALIDISTAIPLPQSNSIILTIVCVTEIVILNM